MSSMARFLAMKFPLLRKLERHTERLASLEPLLYALVAGGCTLYVARQFYGSEFWQLNNAVAWALGDTYDPAHREVLPKIWSAPLDDVFIHFDFARAAARGMPFEWIDGNGYSSGGTSLLYPLVLALGLVVGFRGLNLMQFAAIVAATSVFALLWGLRSAFSSLPRWVSYVVPFGLLSVGALDWSLFSGMEVAFLLAMWVMAWCAWDAVVDASETEAPSMLRPLLELGAAGFFVAATRPEAITSIAVLAVDAAVRVHRRHGWRLAMTTTCLAACPGALVIAVQAVVNRVLTGDASAAGAIVKLEVNNPLLTRADIFGAYWSHLKYQIMRVTQHHFANNEYTGWIVWGLALVALVSPKTRRYASVLWLSLIFWILTVALNGQVVWQNERYTMPAVAWLLAAASLGLGWLVSFLFQRRYHPWVRWLLPSIGTCAALLFLWGRTTQFSDQRWFFGRAARNIFDQHIQTGHLLRAGLKPQPNRVLVGDAGAIPYVADLPGLDIIGLGGTFLLPFARASQWGVGASVELIQHLPKHERPDTFAIYPGWWDSFPLWFTSEISARVPVRGNVICGGHTKVVYRADFSSLDDAERPQSIRAGEHVVDYLDFADVMSEQSHGFALSERAAGFVDMKKLAHPENPERDLWDAGRISSPGLVESFRLHGLTPGRPTRLLFRVAPVGPAKIRVESAARNLGELDLVPSDEWVEVSFELPQDFREHELPLSLRTLEGGPTLYFLWVLEGPSR
jgi:hypothetical protein